MAYASDLIQLSLTPRQADFLGDVQSLAIAAAGTTQGTATALTGSINQVSTSSAGSADGVLLPNVLTYKQSFCLVRNQSANTINVFPASGQSIDGLGTNNPQTIATLKSAIFVKTESGWLTLLGA